MTKCVGGFHWRKREWVSRCVWSWERERERERTQQDENSSERIEKYKLLVWKKTIYSGDLNNGYINYGAILITDILY